MNQPNYSKEVGREYAQAAEGLTDTQRLALIHDIVYDWDGYRDQKNLGELLDEIYFLSFPQEEQKEWICGNI